MQRMTMRMAGAVVVAGLLGFYGPAPAITVPGNANPWLAGVETPGTYGNSDNVPTNSPVLVPDVLIPGGWVEFTSVTGSVSFTPSPSGNPPDGGGSITSNNASDLLGKSTLTAPANSLIGVFLDNTDPSTLTPPAALVFNTVALRDFSDLSPLLRQTFFIGDGQNSLPAVQKFHIPDGATRLFLGSMDGSGWFNNSGSFEVTLAVLPEPAVATILLAAAPVLFRRRPNPDRA